MNTQVAVLCDAATDDRGKLNLLGAFDTICAQQTPVVHPQCAVALRLTFTALDEGAHALKLTLMDADGRAIVPPIEVRVDISLPEDVHFGTRNFIFNLQQLRFENPGFYAVDVRLDNASVANIPLQIKLLPPPEPQA